MLDTNSVGDALIYIFGTLNDLKQHFYHLQSFRSRPTLQLWYKFCLHPTSIEKDMNLFVLQLFLRIIDLVNHPWKLIFRDGGLNKTVPRNHPFLETVETSNNPWKSIFKSHSFSDGWSHSTWRILLFQYDHDMN
jgi:hypothetical protein